jgi:Protein of unknown function (DUF3311)
LAGLQKPLPNELVEIEREAASDRRSSTVPAAVVTAHCLLLRQIIRNSVANLYLITRVGGGQSGRALARPERARTLADAKAENKLPFRAFNSESKRRNGGEIMTGARWLAVLPFLGILVGTAYVNQVEPLVFGLPLVLAWLVGWVVVGAAIVAVIYMLDPANADPDAGREGDVR